MDRSPNMLVLLDELLLLDAGLLTCEVAEVEDAGATDLTVLVDFDRVDERGLIGENPFDAYST